MSVSIPVPAAAVGYNTQTFNPNILLGQNWIKDTQNGTTANATANPDGSVTVAGGGDTWNGQLETYLNGQGEAFGGGFYLQVTMTVPGAVSGLSPWTGGNSNEWPSIWANSVNGSIETDFVEMMGSTPGEYGATLHNWTTGSSQGVGQDIYAPNGNTLHGANTYGMLWISATATSDGSITFYLNGLPVGTPTTWTQANPGLFGIIDGQQMVLRLGAGANSPATFSNVQVWQASTAGNSINGQPAPFIAPTATGPVVNLTPSPDNTVVAGTVGSITDSHNNVWTINNAGQVAVNGIADTTTSRVTKLAYEGGKIWQENADNLWWAKTLATDVWGPNGGTATSPIPALAPSKDNTVVIAGSVAAITDAAGNKWTISAVGQIVVNGVIDTSTSRVTELAYEKGLVWQENADKLWWSKTAPNAVWGPVGGTATSPVPVVITPSANDTVVMAGTANAITDTAGNKWTITASGQVAVNGVADTTTKGVTELDYTKGLVWQENQASLWWDKATPASVWGPSGGTYTPPVSIHVTNQLTAASTTIDATKVHNETDYGATFSLTAPGVATVTLGSAPEKIVFAGMNTAFITAWSGVADVTGGTGSDHYIYHANNATLTIEDFSAAKGDTLTVDAALKSSAVIGSDGHGGTMITFGAANHSVDLKGLPSITTAGIHWV